jgi:hypothetical protein
LGVREATFTLKHMVATPSKIQKKKNFCVYGEAHGLGAPVFNHLRAFTLKHMIFTLKHMAFARWRFHANDVKQ